MSRTTRIPRAALAIVFGLVATTLGCAHLGGAPESEIVARVGNHEITQSELDDAARPQLLKLEIDHQKSLYRNRKLMLDHLIDSQLIEAEAERRGITPAVMLREVKDAADDVPEEEIRALYDEHAEQIGRSYEESNDQLRAHLAERRYEQGKVDLLNRLRSEEQVAVLLDYPELPKIEIPGGASGPARGAEDAPITIVEFSDFQCPYCKKMNETMDQLFEDYPGQIRLVYRHFPLRSHPVARPAAEASACADEQGQFWAYHDLIFDNQHQLSEERLYEFAGTLGIDEENFRACMSESRYGGLVQSDFAAGREAGVQGTPAFFVNGRPLFGAETIESFRAVIDRELAAREG